MLPTKYLLTINPRLTVKTLSLKSTWITTVQRSGATNCKISVQKLSGTWTNPTQMAMSVTDLSKTYNVAEGAKWVDVAGRTIWEKTVLR